MGFTGWHWGRGVAAGQGPLIYLLFPLKQKSEAILAADFCGLAVVQ